ncbi:hypothetical protein WH47_02361 [Habropoda laboriosa]|uniref:Uncharacterized protein n=1 Tax=Habropoda laboriosa TaxID=597456 RepID=A0A0L7RK00_9HYME|nr:hypothetical protein WH47_02361 [Habropoda laboriosa]
MSIKDRLMSNLPYVSRDVQYTGHKINRAWPCCTWAHVDWVTLASQYRNSLASSRLAVAIEKRANKVSTSPYPSRSLPHTSLQPGVPTDSPNGESDLSSIMYNPEKLKIGKSLSLAVSHMSTDYCIVPAKNQFALLANSLVKLPAVSPGPAAFGGMSFPPFSSPQEEQTKPVKKVRLFRYIKMPPNIEHFTAAQETFLKDGVKFYIYTLPSKKHLTVILKGLAKVDPEFILADLRQQDLKPERCVTIKESAELCFYKNPLPLKEWGDTCSVARCAESLATVGNFHQALTQQVLTLLEHDVELTLWKSSFYDTSLAVEKKKVNSTNVL